MNIKSRHKRRFFWTIVCLFGLGIIGIICIPPFINLNKIKPVLEAKLQEQTGIPTRINGNINFSLLGTTTIVAHDIKIPNGTIGSISFSVPFKQILNLQDATLNHNINVYNAHLDISELYPHLISHEIHIYNTTVNFLNHDYRIIRGTLAQNKFNGHIRTSQHKYDISYDNDEFVILNSNDNLHIRGTLFPSGGAAGEMTIATNDINKWFEFEYPKIQEPVNLSMEFNWDGTYGFDFTNIRANNYDGDIKLLPNGTKYLTFNSNDANIDLSFITTDKSILNNTHLDLDLYGHIKINQNIYSVFKIIATGNNNKLELNQVIANNFELQGGTYDSQGLHNTKLHINNLKEKFNCVFSGTPQKWECSNFTYGNITGNITQDSGIFHINATSTDKMPTISDIKRLVSRIGDTGTIDFTFSDMSGVFVVTKQQIIPKFRFAKNTTLTDIDIDVGFLPKFMRTTTGTYANTNGKKTFIPENQDWTLDINNDSFTITGNNFKDLLPNTDLRFMNDMPYSISGTFGKDSIQDLHIIIGGHIISGVATKSGLTLKTPTLNLDKFINEYFKNNFEEQKFLTNHPLATLFEIPTNISLSAESIILNDQEYRNFVYSLKPDTQVFSISDSDRGNLLGIIEKKKFNYDISIQLNKFTQDGDLLPFNAPLNISDSTITGEIILHTSGQTANDLLYNLYGDVDMTFTGGIIQGLGFDNLYASTENLNILNSEYILSATLESGQTRLKRLKLVGKYDNGNFETTRPLSISMPFVDGVGSLRIDNRIMTAEFEFVLRGTAIKPGHIDFKINNNGKREYSLSEILQNIDIGYMRAFIKQHEEF